MAWGTELVLAVDPQELLALVDPADLPELAVEQNGGQVVLGYDLHELYLSFNDTFGDQLERIHTTLLEDRFGAVLRADSRRRALLCQTPAGLRSFATMEIGSFGVDNEPHPLWGLSLWGRYRPIWADWRHERGGSGQPIVLDNDLMGMVEQAHAAVASAIAPFTGAKLTVVECFY